MYVITVIRRKLQEKSEENGLKIVFKQGVE